MVVPAAWKTEQNWATDKSTNLSSLKTDWTVRCHQWTPAVWFCRHGHDVACGKNPSHETCYHSSNACNDVATHQSQNASSVQAAHNIKRTRCYIQGGPKSKPLSRIIIKSYYKASVRLDFSLILITHEYKNIIIMFVLNTLCDLNLWRHQFLCLKLWYG